VAFGRPRPHLRRWLPD